MSTRISIYRAVPRYLNFEFKLRDLYNREKQLERWMHKVNTQLDEPDRSDILQLVAHLQDAEKSIYRYHKEKHRKIRKAC